MSTKTQTPISSRTVPALFCFAAMFATAWLVAGIFLFIDTMSTNAIHINAYIAVSILLSGLTLFATVIAGVLEDPSRRKRSLKSPHGTSSE